MNRLRQYAIVLIALGLVTSAIYGTGAFHSLTASRDANVHVAGDKAGYLSLQPGSANGQYATYTNGKLQLRLDGAVEGEDAPSGGGVNHDARTELTDVFTITNQGAQTVAVWLKDTDKHIDFQRTDGGSLEEKGNAVKLTPGNTISVGLTIDTTDTDVDQLDTQLIINADSDVGGTVSGSHGSSQPNDQHNSQQNDTRSDNDQPGSASEQEVPPTPSDASSVIDDDLRNLINQVINAIKDKHSLIKKYEDELWTIAALHPPLFPTVWMLLYPGQVWETTVGAALGAVGMPSGETPVKEAGSALYFGGWMAFSLTPILGILPDIRDTVQGMANKDPVASVLGLLSIVPMLGKGGDLAQIGYYTSKWVNKVAKTGAVSKVVTMVKSKSGLLSVLPSDVKTKILSKLTDDAGNAKKVDRISDSEMQRMVDAGYDRQTIKQLENGQFKAEDLRAFSAKNVNLDRVKTLRNRGIPADDIRYYVDNDVSLHKVADMRNQQFSPKQIRKLSEQGFDFKKVTGLKREGFTNDDVALFAEKGTDPNTVKQLKYEDFTNDEITDLVKKSDRMYLVKRATLDQAVKLERKGIPKDDVKYYVDNGVSLKLVGGLHKVGNSPNRIRTAITGTPKKIRNRIKVARWGQNRAVPGMNVAVNGRIWCKMKNERDEDALICP